MGLASQSNQATMATPAIRHTPTSSRKRKLATEAAATPAYPTPRSSFPTPGSSFETAICLDSDDEQDPCHDTTDQQVDDAYFVVDEPAQPSSVKRAKRNRGDSNREKRLRQTRKQPPQSFYEIFKRATTQRFYVLSRTRCGTQDCPEEMVEMAGSTGNIYYVCIAKQPSCDCPHARKGAQCKHLLYRASPRPPKLQVMSRVLRAKFDYVYQLALLSSELRDIFANAPPIAAEHTDAFADEADPSTTENSGGHRKPLDDDCPICFNELVGAERETLVWCRAACGQNMHKECLEMWAATKRKSSTGIAGSEVTCPLCRSVWQGDDEIVKKINRTGHVNSEGYVNVADQLGISARRDTSTYSRWWSGSDNPRGWGGGRRGYYANVRGHWDDGDW
ncbi:uncharacterized protein E0L32_001091 [Thyridium curvatum]|uniref:Uncharacterized protein n=1 Tax=Thyridium curvatum TaxID=1093900 RepID=A0A507AU58_9PEZI|nr:uncharacterized protein E0L32_001091 [Thyridium curvatum]TPX11273.1 hypothetical protein E0L32_001091 [Thyridium curvatum]